MQYNTRHIWGTKKSILKFNVFQKTHSNVFFLSMATLESSSPGSTRQEATATSDDAR